MLKRNMVGVIVLSVVAVFFTFSALCMQSFGAPKSSEMDDYVIRNSREETGANNGVTGVVFDYRGLDTLGEATVLFTAVAGVIVIFRRKNK